MLPRQASATDRMAPALSLFSDTFFFFYRDHVKWSRSKVFVVISMVLPATWLVFVGMAFPTRFTDNYIAFVAPGVLVMTMLFNSLQGGILMMLDKTLGYLNKFLTLPVPRESILLGTIAFITFRGTVQATVILLISLLLGVRFPGAVEVVAIYAILVLFGFLISAISTTLAMILNDRDSLTAITTLISMPLFFASSAMVPYESMPSWFRPFAMLNPVSYTIDAIRVVFDHAIPSRELFLLAVLNLLFLAVSFRIFRKYRL